MELYGRLLTMTARGHDPRPRVRLAGGGCAPVPLERWLGGVSAGDELVLRCATAPVLDVGCGPGRLLAALAAAGKPALGIDPCTAAVRLASERGVATVGSVFDLDAEPGAWGTVLLLDGNIGIGGSPVALLRRCAELLRRRGQVVAEVGPPGTPSHATTLRLEGAGAVSAWFRWGRVSVDALGGLGDEAGLHLSRTLHHEGRWFGVLTRP
jgi:SAM-dependent methyltransferase